MIADPIALRLGDPSDTLRLGTGMATVLGKAAGTIVVLLRGDLGSGKTTLVRGLVAALPGGDEAEVASPSFNLVNIYPTRPEVVHMDLYRLRGNQAGELFEEYAEAAPPGGTGPGRILAVEWAEHLPDDCLAGDHLSLTWRYDGTGRRVTIEAHGETGAALVSALAAHLRETCHPRNRTD
ncbi:tRNA (adenosine(37)-N6)-threonylcarbamoyltransferase complex ATPase subunit type 1 TsaE [Desulfolutivibrio sulfoxidireducens]|uniref:tRNA (adenosine(37)-N6)-threonylcarbamoyltransferase complex ATPase subunit type 1 TsaE n=1 Tax=Desulfolutivibrio sulfoxidireducens TaxID=2773299 RepID=UPI00159E49E9|nr:tRNA (adenosine(37)-N6)-threonylcarbamoyltransferase complex ATPase subunit type 1 TsaE [Desulfolutivibrio sulfoxidireducens]QLA15529.1 tRNA (adenosine(37)-N6)-threonylcarbamoyltransferase complex ATPase subunit type 1 TsaE [Desulfolutivibrio sulfoxidireducens]